MGCVIPMDDPFQKIDPSQGYKYTDIGDILEGPYLNTAIILWQAGVLERDAEGRYNGGKIAVLVQEYHRRLSVPRQLAEELGRDITEIRVALLKSGLQEEYFRDIAKKPRTPRYALVEGKDVGELREGILNYLQERQSADASPSKKYQRETVTLSEIQRGAGLSEKRVKHALKCLVKSRVATTSSSSSSKGIYSLPDGLSKEDFLEKVRLADSGVLLGELPLVLNLPYSKMRRHFTPEVRDEYLEVAFGEGSSAVYRFRDGKTADDLALAIRLQERMVDLGKRASQEVKDIDWLMFLQGRYPQDIGYAAKIELFLRSYTEITEERRWSLEHQMLDVAVGILSEHMIPSSVDRVSRQVQEQYGVSLQNILQLKDPSESSLVIKVFDEEGYGLFLQDKTLTLPRLSGRLGKSILSLKQAFHSKYRANLKKPLFKKYLEHSGGTRRVPHYKLRPEMALEDMVREVLVKTEWEDTRTVTSSAEEYAHSAHRTMFSIRGRYHLDKSYQAKIAFYERGYAPVLLRHGWQGMQLIEHAVLDRMLQIFFSNIDGPAGARLLGGVEYDYGVSLKTIVEGSIGTRKDDPFERYRPSPGKAIPQKAGKVTPKVEIPAREKPARKKPVEEKAAVNKTTTEIPEKAPNKGNAAWQVLAGDDDDDEEFDDGDLGDDDSP